MIDSIKTSYNKFESLPNVPYEIISYLMSNNQMIWKLLKYSDSNAWQKADLSSAEKRALIYTGQPDDTDYRIFMDAGQDGAWVKEACILRISPLEVLPTNYVVGYVTIGLEVYCHAKVNALSNYQTRIDTIIQQLIETLNGADINKLGRVYFDHDANPRCRVSTIGQIPFKGKMLVMCNWAL